MLEHGSFKIELINQVVIVRFYGEWNKETSTRMCEEFQSRVKTIIENPWACIVDLSHWGLGGPEVWEPIIKINDWCTENNQKFEAVICRQELQKFIMEKTHEALPKTESSFFSTEIDAKKWLIKYGYKI